jgi:hypothetical protein
MARRPDGPKPRNHFVRTRVDEDEKRLIDTMRGSLSESQWVRRLIADEAERRGVRS